MLYAVDVDGTIAIGGNWYARWLASAAKINIPEADLASIQYGVEFWDLPQVQALTHEQRAALRKHAHEHHKDADHHINAVPIPGAVEALHMLAQSGGVIYTTCRKRSHRKLTSEWLERYGFPSPEQVHCCPRYHVKFLEAQHVAEPKEPIVLIDDLAREMVLSFRALAIHDRSKVLGLIKRITIVAIGCEEPPTFPFKVPFPVLALPSWRLEDLENLGVEPEQERVG